MRLTFLSATQHKRENSKVDGFKMGKKESGWI